MASKSKNKYVCIGIGDCGRGLVASGGAFTFSSWTTTSAEISLDGAKLGFYDGTVCSVWNGDGLTFLKGPAGELVPISSLKAHSADEFVLKAVAMNLVRPADETGAEAEPSGNPSRRLHAIGKSGKDLTFIAADDTMPSWSGMSPEFKAELEGAELHFGPECADMVWAVPVGMRPKDRRFANCIVGPDGKRIRIAAMGAGFVEEFVLKMHALGLARRKDDAERIH